MLIKKAYQGELRNLLSRLRAAVQDNRTYVAFAKKKFKYFSIFSSLSTAGIIENYEERDELVIIRLKQTYWKSQQNPVKAFYSVDGMPVNHKGTISNKQLKKQQRYQGPVVHLQISTDRGNMSGATATHKQCGGVPLFKAY